MMIVPAQERDLLVFQNQASDETGFLKELMPKHWNVLTTQIQNSALDIIRSRNVSVGIACFYAGDSAEYAEQINLIRSCERVKWIALLDFLPDSASRLSSMIYSKCYDFMTRPINPEHLSFSIGHAYGLAQLGNSNFGSDRAFTGAFGMIGRSPQMMDLYSNVEKISASDEFVMIQGETGTGKELIAKAIHDNSSRRDKPFIPINCAALSKDLLFSELFGHTKGAFTDAYGDVVGLLESANGGTVFFDEVGELGLEQQAALLRFAQERTFYRIGGTTPVLIDVRVLSATKSNINSAVKSGEFRSDLYFRLNVLGITSPPLRHRKADAALISKCLLKNFVKLQHLNARKFSRDAIRAINRYPWPGNVRELIHCVNRAATFSDSGIITADDLALGIVSDSGLISLKESRELAEANAIKLSLHKTGKVAFSAKELGISRVTLYRLMSKYGVNRPD